MVYRQRVETECYYCKTPMVGYKIEDFDEVLKIVSKDLENKSLGIQCDNCNTVFCFDHKKQMGWKMFSGYDKIQCPQCGFRLKEHQTIMNIKVDLDEKKIETRETELKSDLDERLSIDEQIRALGKKGDFLEIVPLIGRAEMGNPDVEKALKEVFPNCKDEKVYQALTKRIIDNPSRENIASSLLALTFTNSPKAISYVMQVYDANISIVVGSNTKSISPLLKDCMREIGETAFPQILKELKKREKNLSAVMFLCETIFPYLKENTWKDLFKLAKEAEYTHFRNHLIRTLSGAKWQPQTTEEKVFALVVNNKWKDLEALGTEIEPYLLDWMKLKNVDKRLVKALGNIGSSKSVNVLTKFVEERKHAKEAILALAAIEDERGIDAILEHASNTSGLQSLSVGTYTDALVKFGSKAKEALDKAAGENKKIQKIKEKVLKKIK